MSSPFVRKPQQVWLLWLKAKTLSVKPSSFLGLEEGSYVAYCLDEAVTFFGLMVENKLEEAGQGKPSKEDRRAQAAREKVLDSIFGKDEKKKTSGFADPALMFS